MKGTGKRTSERDSVSIKTPATNHSRGSSITKSMTPNLSPHSTLSTSSSSGSLRQEAEYTPPNVPPSSAGGGGIGVEPRATLEEEEEAKDNQREVNEEVPTGREGSGLSVEGDFSNCTTDSSGNVVLEQLESIHLSKSENSVLPELQRATSHSHSSDTTIQAPPTKGVVAGMPNVDPSLSISSPPGLSKSRSQPLSSSSSSSSKHSDMVCRQLDLGTSVNPSSVTADMDGVVAGQQVAPRMLSQQFLSRGSGGGDADENQVKSGSGGVEQRATGGVSSNSDGESSMISPTLNILFTCFLFTFLCYFSLFLSSLLHLIFSSPLPPAPFLSSPLHFVSLHFSFPPSLLLPLVLSSLASAGSNHFGGLGVNWSLPPRPPINPYLGMFPAALSAFPTSMNPYVSSHSQLPTPSSSSSSAKPTASLPPSHSSHLSQPTSTSSSTNHTPSSLLTAAIPPKENNHNRKQVDDGDELGRLL